MHMIFHVHIRWLLLQPSLFLSLQPLPKIETQFLGTNANLVDLDLLATFPVIPQVSSSGPSPANPFGLSSSPRTSTAVPAKPVGNPFDTKSSAPSLIQLAGNSTVGFGGV